MKITMIGHSCVLIEASGKRILTDPFWNAWGNPAFARIGTPAVTREEAAHVDAVLVSHDHWDHTDGRYFRMLGDVPAYAPAPANWMVRLIGAHKVQRVRVGQNFKVGEVKVPVVPAIHVAVTVGFILEAEGKTIYFAGDTFRAPFMRKIGDRYKLDAALMPVTTYRLPMTMSEKGAVKAVCDLHPAVVVPIHLGIKPRSPLLRTGQTPEHFEQLLKQADKQAQVKLLSEGKSLSL
jgi:L-ascorbate metabolism protein UlaG (beta-lactamase superfamily)